MKYYEDMHVGYPGSDEKPKIFLVGWISNRTDFRKGKLDQDVAEKLNILCDSARVEYTRGFWRCDFCKGNENRYAKNGGFYTHSALNSSLFLPGDNCYFYGPSLVAHYAFIHNYLPPDEFIEAVKNVDLEKWRQECEKVYEGYWKTLLDYEIP